MSELGCNYCSRSRLGSDGESSSSSSSFGCLSADEGLREFDHWLLRAEVDYEWQQLEREIQVRIRHL